MVRSTQVEFFGKSVLITLIVTLLSSFLIYLIVGHTLSPLRKLSLQIREIQAKNLQQPILLESDSTEIVRLTESFNEMLHRLNDAFLIQKQFFANAAHELRTPLAVMFPFFKVQHRAHKLSGAFRVYDQKYIHSKVVSSEISGTGILICDVILLDAKENNKAGDTYERYRPP